LKGFIRADFDETARVCLFPTTKETIHNIKMPLGGV
jgi:hypothetical protein